MSSRRKHLRCNDCDASFPSPQIYCSVCGSLLVAVAANASADTSSDAAAIGGLTGGRHDELFLELIGEDFRHAIEESLSLSNPNRMVSKEYLKNISIVELDSREGILVDSSLHVGPLTLLTVMASFGDRPALTEFKGDLIMADPICGEAPLVNSEHCKGAIVCLKRGVVSFAQKAMTAQSSGAAAVVVIQSGPNWPFVMTDTSNELELKLKGNISIPIVMIGQDDGKIIEEMISKANLKSGAPPRRLLPAMLHFGPPDNMCSVCHDTYNLHDKIIKLPCRHAYHANCLKTWLSSHSTCPLCRHQLPKATKLEAATAARSPPAGSNSVTHSSALPYFA